MRCVVCAFVSLMSFFVMAASVDAEEKRPIKIGVILPLSGPLAEFGVAMQNGLALAQRKEWDLFRKLQIVYEDSKYSPQETVSIFRRFTADPDVRFVINFGCPTSQAIAPLAEQAKMPTAMFCSSLLLTKGKQYSFGMCSPANEWASILWRHLKKQSLQKLCLVLTENDYLMSEYRALQGEIEREGGAQSITVLDRYTPTESDFRSSVMKLPSHRCDALGVYLLPSQVRLFLNQARHLIRSTDLIFGTDVFESSEEIAASNGAMEGSVFVNLAVPAEFKDEYITSFRNDSQLAMACVAHDIVVRAARVLGRDQDAPQSKEDIMASITRSGEEVGRCGRSRFIRSESGEQFVRFPLALKRIVHGEIQEFAQ